jgi:hypothetical protein
MPKEQRKFADDGWAIWVDGEDMSTVYINDWINPKGKSYVDIAVRILGVKACKFLHVYVPFCVSRDEIEDVSLLFNDTKVLNAVFSAACIVDYKKNEHASEIAYNGKTVDVIHMSTLEYQMENISEGVLININLEELQPFIDNDEAYIVWRMPHKSLDEIFKPHVNMGSTLQRLIDILTTPVVSEKYGYSIRINESRLLPDGITRIGGFHRQKLDKTVTNISVDESYELNDAGCYRIRRLEGDIYKEYLPANYSCEDVIVYQWRQKHETDLHGQFNYYYSITKDSVSKRSMFLYLLLLPSIDVLGNFVADAIYALIDLLK